MITMVVARAATGKYSLKNFLGRIAPRVMKMGVRLLRHMQLQQTNVSVDQDLPLCFSHTFKNILFEKNEKRNYLHSSTAKCRALDN